VHTLLIRLFATSRNFFMLQIFYVVGSNLIVN